MSSKAPPRKAIKRSDGGRKVIDFGFDKKDVPSKQSPKRKKPKNKEINKNMEKNGGSTPEVANPKLKENVSFFLKYQFKSV